MIATRPDRRHGPTIPVVAVLVTLIVAALLAVAPDAARAAGPASVQVSLSVASLEGSGPDAAVVVSGQVTNSSDRVLHDVRSNLWRSTARLRSSQALESAIAADDPPLGRWEPVAAENSAPLTAASQPLEPGGTRLFTVRGRLGDFGMTATDTSYWVGAVVRAAETPGGADATVGSARTLVTVPGPGSTALVVPVVELSAAPRLIRPGLFTDDGLAAELAGRLTTLLQAAARPGTVWVVDPALLAEARDMADGYEVVDGDGARRGTGAAAASAWLEAFGQLPTDRGHTTLFARPDLGAAATLGAADLIAPAERVTTAAAPRGLGLLVTLTAPDTAAVDAAAPLAAPVLAVGATPAAAWVRAQEVDLLSATQPGVPLLSPTLSDTPLNRVAVLEARARAAGAQVRLLRTDDDVAADALSRPPWAERRPLADLLATDTTPWNPPAGPAPGALDADMAARLSSLPAALTTYAAAAPDSGLADVVDDQVLRGTSQAWLGDRAAQDAWLTTVEGTVGYRALDRGITLGISPRFSMSGTESEFPVTVTNRLTDTVQVVVVASTDNPQRIRFVDSPTATIAPGASETVVMRTRALGSGVVNGQIHVETPGQLRLTPDVPVIVETTNFGTVGWVLVVGSAVVLLVSTALRIRQVRARQGGRLDG